MFDYPYIVELLSPKRSTDVQIEAYLDRFAERYQRVIDAGRGISIPDTGDFGHLGDNAVGPPHKGCL